MKNNDTPKGIEKISYPENFKKAFESINQGEFIAQSTEIKASSGPEPDLQSAIDELDNLVGLETVKETIKELIIFLERRGKEALPCLHMVFTGSPGTAKTTVARIITKILAQSGIIEKNLLVETERCGLIGGYMGQTALKTEKMINKSLGGVLFIDEAYSLYTGRGGGDYGDEAVATLVKAMEDKRDKFVCIMAGYTKEMEAMIDMNPGLRGRIQFFIDFPDYAVTELMQIFDVFCNKRNYELSNSARQMLHDEFKLLSGTKNKNFANGRLVRKFFERICIKQALRTCDYMITEKDITAALKSPDIAAIRNNKGKIGFALAKPLAQ